MARSSIWNGGHRCNNCNILLYLDDVIVITKKWQVSVDWIRRQTLFRTGYDKWVKIGQQVWKSWKLSLSENGWRIKSGTFLRDWIYSERIGLLYEYATLAESSSNLNPPTPSNFSRLMYPFHRIDTPFSINGESKKTWKMTKVNVLKNKDHNS